MTTDIRAFSFFKKEVAVWEFKISHIKQSRKGREREVSSTTWTTFLSALTQKDRLSKSVLPPLSIFLYALPRNPPKGT